ncbi:hypothetical protein [Bifidobacterium biavatii]|uniref:Sugar-binding protein n=1 Tax=Bifidobacterium biavatii DSM 23969 TaxID=1437608 RepID=A0A086ZUW7_9BIFI|nr:hypothetical protein [Bifidobacterium biavatii]KFI50317.1 sugar-binding protein [Bifidobacterium biavatii DSM 23969]
MTETIAADQTVDVALNAADVAAAARNHNGLTYKGFGVLSGNATSALLMDYKAEHPDAYWTLVRTLFAGDRPLMNTVKIEMGNDRNNSTGPNVATMRDRDEYPAVRREPGFQLAADARRYQPGVHVSILRWHAPTWVRDNDDVYRWYKNTILAAYREYGVMVDSVNPDVNERTADLDWIAEFAERVHADTDGFLGNGPDDPNAGFRSDRERDLFRAIKVITSDEETTGTFGGDVIANPRYFDAMDVAAYHYSVEDDPQGNFKRLADEYDKEVWNSEAQAVFSNSADRPNNTMDNGLGERTGTGIGGIGGPLEMANTLIKGFVESRRTAAIYQPAIGSCYEHMEYASKELISARDPWSGWIYYDAGCAALEHFARFANLGWEPADGANESLAPSDEGAVGGADWGREEGNSLTASVSRETPFAGEATRPVWRAIPQASGSEVGGNNPVSGARHGEPSYLTLAAPDGSDFSTVIVNDSSYRKTYRIAIDPSLPASGKPVTVWQTRAADTGQPYDANWRKPVAVVCAQHVMSSEAAGEVETSSEDFSAPLRSGRNDMGECGVVNRNDGEEDRGAVYEITVEPWTMVTATTLDSAVVDPATGELAPKPAYAYAIPHTPENSRPVLGSAAGHGADPANGVLYADDFNYADEPQVEVWKFDKLVAEDYLTSRGGETGATPRYTTDTNGAFEVVPDAARGHALRQQIDWTHAGNAWIEGDPRTAIGDMRWTNYRVSVDAYFEPYDGRAPYALVGAREMGGNKFTTDICGVDFKIRADGVWLLRNFGNEVRRGHLEDLKKRAAEAGVRPFAPGAGAWNTITLEVNGTTATVFINGAKITTWSDANLQSAGRVNLGTSFNHVRFSNLRVERVATPAASPEPGASAAPASPYYTQLIDDMHMTSWDDGSPILTFTGNWTHDNGQGMFTYMRTISRTATAESGFRLAFEGSGLHLFGPSDGRAVLDVYVDGHLALPVAPVNPTNGSLRCEFRLEGLEPGRHDVEFRTATSAPFALDAIGVLA